MSFPAPAAMLRPFEHADRLEQKREASRSMSLDELDSAHPDPRRSSIQMEYAEAINRHNAVFDERFAGLDQRLAEHAIPPLSIPARMHAALFEAIVGPDEKTLRRWFQRGELRGTVAKDLSHDEQHRRSAFLATRYLRPQDFCTREGLHPTNPFARGELIHQRAISFILYRRLGLAADAIRDLMSQAHWARALRERVRMHRLRSLLGSSLRDLGNTQRLQFLQHDFQAQRLPGLVPRMAALISSPHSSLIFETIGGFRSHPDMLWLHESSGFCCRRTPESIRARINGVGINLITLPDTSHVLSYMPIDLEDPHLAAILMTHMHRQRVTVDADAGLRYLSLPFVLITIYPYTEGCFGLSRQAGHAIVVEFDVEGDAITTPARIVDPVLGVLHPRGGMTSLSFRFIIEFLFHFYTRNHRAGPHAPALLRRQGFGLVQAEQLMMVTPLAEAAAHV